MNYSFFLLFLLLISCKQERIQVRIEGSPLIIDSSEFGAIKKKFNYESIDTPSKLLSGLQPKLPLVLVSSSTPKNNSLSISQGMFQVWYSIVTKINDTLILIDTEQKFKAIFAPIDDEKEALGYVAYMTETYPRYDIKKNPRYRVFSSHFPSTYSKRVAGGFEVLLHDYKKFGCGPHPYYYKIFKITDEGEIIFLKKVKLYEDPAEDALCVD